MKQYRPTTDKPDSAIQLLPEGVTFPVNQCREHRKMLAEIAAGEAEMLPFVPAELNWKDKRTANVADGGYGTVREQLEMIGEGGPTALATFQAHIAAVKANIPKPV